MDGRPPARGNPAGQSTGTLRLLRLKPGQVDVVRILSESYQGCFTHYHRKRSEYCPPGEQCDFHQLPKVWKGYCSCEQWQQIGALWMPVVLEITESLDQDFWGRFGRGQVWQLTYKTKAKGGALEGELWEQRDPCSFPEPYPLTPVLDALYHRVAQSSVRLTLDNPLPRRVRVAASAGSPPRRPAGQEPVAAPPTAEQQHKFRERRAAYAAGIGTPIEGNGKDGAH